MMTVKMEGLHSWQGYRRLYQIRNPPSFSNTLWFLSQCYPSSMLLLSLTFVLLSLSLSLHLYVSSSRHQLLPTQWPRSPRCWPHSCTRWCPSWASRPSFSSPSGCTATTSWPTHLSWCPPRYENIRRDLTSVHVGVVGVAAVVVVVVPALYIATYCMCWYEQVLSLFILRLCTFNIGCAPCFWNPRFVFLRNVWQTYEKELLSEAVTEQSTHVGCSV